MTRERIAALPSSNTRRTRSHFQEPELTQNLMLVESLKSIGKQYGRSAGEIAIAWTLQNPAVTAAFVGGRNAAQVEGISKAWNLKFTKEDLLHFRIDFKTEERNTYFV